MANGLAELPGHAYAPGMEPDFFSFVMKVDPGSAVATLSTPTLALGAIALVLYAARKLSPGTKVSLSGWRYQGSAPEGGIARAPTANTTVILARTITDSNFARELRHQRMKPAEATEAD